MRRRYDLSTALIAIGAVAVLVSLFLEWFEPEQTAFDVFELVDWALLALAVAAIVIAFAEATGTTAPTTRLGWLCGLVAFLIIAQLLDPPPAARDASRELGAWIALGGSAIMVVGAVLALAQISVTIDVAGRERRRRTAAVDARAGDDPGGSDDAEGEGPGGGPGGGSGGPGPEDPSSGGSGLWGKGSRRSAASSGGERREPIIPPAPAEDPDKTQPLSPVDRPKE